MTYRFKKQGFKNMEICKLLSEITLEILESLTRLDIIIETINVGKQSSVDAAILDVIELELKEERRRLQVMRSVQKRLTEVLK